MKKIVNIMLSILIPITLTQLNLEASERGEPIKSQVESGTYVPGDVIIVQKLKFLPIPAGTNDYAFFQSVQKVSNIVLGKFKVGEKEIILIQDNNADGQVDLIAHWMIGLNRIDREGEPDKYCTAENFKKLKEAIINGKNETIPLGGKNYTISPNKEGIPEMEKLLAISSNISKYKQGLRIKKVDTDEPTNEMAVYSFSYNIEDSTADMAFETKYYYLGKSRIRPIITQGVYCLKSEDPFVIETVKKLREMSTKYFPK